MPGARAYHDAMSAIRTSGLTKAFRHARHSTVALDDVSVTIAHGRVTAVIGESGAGKTTLGRILAGLERADAGTVDLGGSDRISVIFQGSRLLRRRTALQNVALPLEIAGVPRAERIDRARRMLARVGLAHKEDSYPSQLSGGQSQRVGIARALITDPDILLCDEATSGLDPETTESILSLIRSMQQELGITVVLITHEMDVVRSVADDVIAFADGRVTESGAVREIIHDTDSLVGARILPTPAVSASDGRAVVEATFASSVSTADWIHALGREMRSPVELLGATVQEIDGVTVGRLVLGVAAESRAELVAWLRQRGLVVAGELHPVVELSRAG
jgi:D-methionine transport system ATP-binding protein